jgi:uncharacterized protein YkwD
MPDEHKLFLPEIRGPVVTATIMPPAPFQWRSVELVIFALLNDARVEAGKALLVRNMDLGRAARAHSDDMAARGYVAHDTLYGLVWHERIRQYYQGGALGETIAAGQKTAAEVVAAWLGSQGHRAIILEEGTSPTWTVAGVGASKGGPAGTYYVLDVAN